MTGDPLTQLRITARENQILDAAVAVFAEKGFHTTTIHEIARRAGLADGTIYTYFDRKTDLLLGIFERLRTAVLLDTPPTPPGDLDPRALLTAALGHALSALQPDDFALFRIVISEMMVDAALRRAFTERVLLPALATVDAMLDVEAARRTPELTPTDLRLATRTTAATVIGLMVLYVMEDKTVRSEWDRLPAFLANQIMAAAGH